LARFLIDTNTVIDHLRQRAPAVEFVRVLTDRPALSAMTVAELYAGVREGAERARLAALVAGSQIIDVDAQLAEHAGLLYRR
jgi:hypothetical protein